MGHECDHCGHKQDQSVVSVIAQSRAASCSVLRSHCRDIRVWLEVKGRKAGDLCLYKLHESGADASLSDGQ